MHPHKNTLAPTVEGLRFLGYRVLHTHIGLEPEDVYRFRHRLRRWRDQYARYEIEVADVLPRVMSWIGHARQADTETLRERLFGEHVFHRTAAE